MSKEYELISTSDNPFNPHTQWDDWYAWDLPRYASLALLGRVIATSSDLPRSLQHDDYADALATIISENVSGKHIAVTGSAPEPEDDTP
jgi:hypothetical protein